MTDRKQSQKERFWLHQKTVDFLGALGLWRTLKSVRRIWNYIQHSQQVVDHVLFLNIKVRELEEEMRTLRSLVAKGVPTLSSAPTPPFPSNYKPELEDLLDGKIYSLVPDAETNELRCLSEVLTLQHASYGKGDFACIGNIPPAHEPILKNLLGEEATLYRVDDSTLESRAWMEQIATLRLLIIYSTASPSQLKCAQDLLHVRSDSSTICVTEGLIGNEFAMALATTPPSPSAYRPFCVANRLFFFTSAQKCESLRNRLAGIPFYKAVSFFQETILRRTSNHPIHFEA